MESVEIDPKADQPAPNFISLLKPPRRRRLMPFDVAAMAKILMEAPLTEQEACLQCNIHPGQWRTWRNRHKDTFDTLLARIKGADLKNIIDRIRAAGISGPRPDWRALAWIGEKVHPDRLAPNYGATMNTQVNIQFSVQAVLDKVRARKQALPGVEQAKVIEQGKNEDKASS